MLSHSSCQANANCKLLHANVVSIIKNINKLEQLIQEIKVQPEIIGITETKLKDHFQHKPTITGYTFINKNSLTNAGGVGFFIKSNLSFKIINDYELKLNSCEDLWVEVYLKNNRKLTFGVIYRHPKGNLNDFKLKFEQTIENLNKNNSSYIICGDYNIDLLKCNLFINDYIESLLSLGCDQHINEPTRHSYNDTSTLLDHIYSNIPNSKIKCNIIKNDISDHLPVMAQINFKTNNYIKQKIIKRDMKNFDRDQFLQDLQNEMEILQNSLHEFDDVNDLVKDFLFRYDNTINLHAPNKIISTKQQKLTNKPWITPSLLKSIKNKNKLFRRYIKFKTDSTRDSYKKFRNKLTHLLDISKKQYFSKLFNISKSDPKTLWKNAEKVINFKKNKQNSVNVIEHNGELITDHTKITNIFNNYFVSVGNNLSKDIPNKNSPNDAENLIKSNKDSMFLTPITNDEILKLINNLNVNKSTPSSSSSIKFIKISAPVISGILTIIFNKCLSEGAFPELFKIAEVIPVYKAGSKTCTSNFRPISKLSPFAKLLEQCIFKRLNDFFSHNNLLYSSQFGFRQNSSTENAVLQIYNQLLTKLKKKQISCSIFIDLKKAFDTVNHSILLKKLSKYGVRGITNKLFHSYLSHRKQYTLVNGQKSDYQQILCGVPQGSTLGPLLFLIYINDFHQASNFELNLFADDAYLCMSNYYPQRLETEVNSELLKVQEWLNNNKLTINLNKTTYLIITNRKITFNFQIKINSTHIKENNQSNYLGVIIDKKLNWKPYLNLIKNKLSNGCWALNKLKKYLNQDAMKTIYYGLIYQRLQYCISCWGGVAPTNLKKLAVLQKRAVRIITGSHWQTSSSPLFKNLGLLKLNEIYKLQLAKIMYRINNDTWLGNYNMLKIDQIHSYSTRAATSSNYYIGSAKTTSRNSLVYVGSKIWMEIPAELKFLNFYLFKNRLKKHFISLY